MDGSHIGRLIAGLTRAGGVRVVAPTANAAQMAHGAGLLVEASRAWTSTVSPVTTSAVAGYPERFVPGFHAVGYAGDRWYVG